VRIEDIEYTVAGSRMVGHLAIDDDTSGPRPGVLVCHEGPGLDEHAKDRAEPGRFGLCGLRTRLPRRGQAARAG